MDCGRNETCYSLHDPARRTAKEGDYLQRLEQYVEASLGTNVDKLRNFAKYVPRQSLGDFLAKAEIFRKILNVHGHVMECGVFLGGSLLCWGQLSAIFEPVNHTRRVVGFDTFCGFPGISDKDLGRDPRFAQAGALASHAEADVREAIELYDMNRTIGHVPRIELVRGDATETIPRYLGDNPHTVVSLLYLDFDLYEPTKIALEACLPRMPKGSVLAFDELNEPAFPGETLAVLETVGIRSLRIERFAYTSQLSYAVLD
jgi:hypothetical protein